MMKINTWILNLKWHHRVKDRRFHIQHIQGAEIHSLETISNWLLERQQALICLWSSIQTCNWLKTKLKKFKMILFGFIKVTIQSEFLKWKLKELTKFFAVLETHLTQLLPFSYSCWQTIKEDKWRTSLISGQRNGMNTLSVKLVTSKDTTIKFLI